ncbi:MAG: ImmA/IrrE family metallo-endopeptidase [Verrucomicrobia bacterium]|nr:ImmA/IrrE family metallo-endopeptidase [Verrucomicrobiota bacterium]
MSAQSQARYVKVGRRVWSHKSVLALLDSANGTADPEVLIRDRARGLVSQAMAVQWSGPPYDPKILAGLRDIAVEPTDEAIGAEARILAKPDGSLLIEYDPTKAKARVNFSICHEIAHTFFPDCFETTRHRRKEHDSNYELECLCDLGAAELLMPHEPFDRDLATLGVSLDSVRELTTRYAASGEAVLIRIAQLSSKACAVVFLSEKLKPVQERAAQTTEFDFGLLPVAPKLRVDYVLPTESFSTFIPAHKSVPDDSVAYRCLQGHDIEEAVEQWDIPSFGLWRVQAVRLPTSNGSSRRVAALVVAS